MVLLSVSPSACGLREDNGYRSTLVTSPSLIYKGFFLIETNLRHGSIPKGKCVVFFFLFLTNFILLNFKKFDVVEYNESTCHKLQLFIRSYETVLVHVLQNVR